MEVRTVNEHARAAAWTSIAGAITMLIGAALWAAVDDGQMGNWLESAGAAKTQLVANLSFWIVGVLLLGIGVRSMADLTGIQGGPEQVARVAAATAVPLAIVSFIAMAALVVQIAPDSSATSVAIADVVGWIGIRADDLATALIVGLAPLSLSLAGRGTWAPTWLVAWGVVAGMFGAVSLVGIYISALADIGFLVVPIGVFWMIAAGVTVLRRA